MFRHSAKQMCLTLLFSLLISPFIYAGAFLANPPLVLAASNSTINFQTKIVQKNTGLTPVNGSPSCINAGADTCDIRVSIYDSPSGGTLLWAETHSNIELGTVGGLINLSLNSVCNSWESCGGGSGVNWGSDSTIYLQLELDTDGNGDFSGAEIFARKLVGSVPFAYYADTAGSINGLTEENIVQLVPGATPQDVSAAANPLIYLDETDGANSPNLIQLMVGGTDAFVVGNSGSGYFAGTVSVGTSTATAYINAAAATTSQASLRLLSSAGVNPTTPNSGDLWWNGTNLNFRTGSSTVDLLAAGLNSFVQGGNAFGALAVLGTTDTNALAFNTGGVERMRLGTNGTLGIGTTSATSQLQINTGTSSGAITMSASNGSSTFTTSASITLNAGDYIVPAAPNASQAREVTVGGTGTSFTVSPAFDADVTSKTFTIYRKSIMAQGARPILSLNQVFSPFASQEWQLRVGGVGVGSASFDIYNATSGQTAIRIDDDGDVLIGSAENYGGPGNASRLYVYGGANGANIDVMGNGAVSDQAVIELQSSDYATSTKSLFLQYYGVNGVGTTMGYNNQYLGVLSFSGDQAIIRTKDNIPLRFGVFDSEVARFEATSGNLTLLNDLTVDGGDILTTQSTFNLLNTGATTLNFAGAATTLNIGGAASSTVNIGPASTTATTINFGGGSSDTGCTVDGSNGNLSCSGTISGAFTVGDDSLDFDKFADALALDAATDIALGALTLSTSGTGALNFASTGQVTIAGNVDATNGLDVTGANLTVGGTGVVATTAGALTTSGLITAGNGLTVTTGATSLGGTLGVTGATTLSSTLGVTGATTLSSSLQVGADITTNATSINLLNTTATTLSFAGAATTLNIGGAASSTVNIGPAGTTATTINFGGGSADTGCTIDGSNGNLSCSGTISGSLVLANDSLDFDKFADALTLDANLTLDQDSFTWVQSFNGTSATGFAYNADSLTSGTALAVSSNSTNFTGTLFSLDLNGNATDNTGDVFALSILGTNSQARGLFLENRGNGNSLVIYDEASDTTPFVLDALGNLSVGGTSSVGGTLNVEGVATLESGIVVGADIVGTASGISVLNFNVDSINFGGEATTINIGPATGATSINFAGGNASSGCTMDGSGNLTCSGTINAGTFGIPDDSLNFAQFSDSLALDAATNIALGSLTLSTSGTGALNFASTGQVTFAGNVDAINGLDVTGATTLSSTLGVSGLTTLSAGLTASGSLNLNNNASTNTTNIGTGTTTGAITIGGGGNTLSIDTSAWDITAAGAASGFTTLSTSGLITAGNGLTVTTGATSLGGTLGVTGATTLSSTLAVGGNITTSASTISVFPTTATTVNFASVATSINIGPGSTDTVSINFGGGSASTGCTINGNNGNLTCTGIISGGSFAIPDDSLNFAQFSDSLTLDAATNIALGSLTLSTSGTGALNFASTGQVTFAGNVDANNGLDVTGATTLSSTLGVNGLATLSAGLTLTGATNINNNASTNTTNIGTGTTTGAITIGGGSNTLGINTSSWDITTAGAASGFTTFNASGMITGTGGISISGGTVGLNVNGGTSGISIGTGTYTGTIGLGAVGASVIVATSTWNIGTDGTITTPSTITAGNLVSNANLTATGIVRFGNTANNYAPTNTTWNTGQSTLVLNALDYSVIAFHDSANRVDFIRSGAGTITLGYDGGFGTAAIEIPGTLAVTGNTTVTGTLGVTGATTLTDVTASGTSVILSGIPVDAANRSVCINNATGLISRNNGACGTSSIRYKDNVQNISYGLNEVLQLRPVFFQYKEEYDTDTSRKLGFIAEEVEAIIPEVGVYLEDGTLQTLDYSKLTSLNVRAIQELNAKFDTNVGQIPALDLRITNVESQVGNLSTQIASQNTTIANQANQINDLRADLDQLIADATITVEYQLPGTASFNDLTVASRLAVSGQLVLSDKNIGTATIAAGQTEVVVNLPQAFPNNPVVVASPVDSFVTYAISNVSASSFKIIVSEPTTTNVSFNWFVSSR